MAWVAYWGCASTASVDSCEKQFHAAFDVGVVPVTFTAIDHFIPCYRDPPNPLKAQEFKCFEHIRLRVKDKQSIPGWSKVTSGLQQQDGSATGEQRITVDKVLSPANGDNNNKGAEQKQGTTKASSKQETPKQQKRTRTKTVSVAARGEIAQE